LRFELAELDLLIASVGRRLDREAILHPAQVGFIRAAERLRQVQSELTELDVLLGSPSAAPSSSPAVVEEDVNAILERLLEESRGAGDHAPPSEPSIPTAEDLGAVPRKRPKPSGGAP
jgi:hypothetical protein